MKKPHRWTKEEEDYLLENYPTGDIDDMAKKFHVSRIAVTAYANRRGIKRSVFWTPERDRQLTEIYPDHKNSEIAQELGCTEGAVSLRAFALKLRKTEKFMYEHSSKAYFQKGHVPHNKGKRMKEYLSEKAYSGMKKTFFKKGHVPYNTKPFGAERAATNGYLLVKVNGGFRAKHVVLWEQAHGKIPKGFVLRFKDGDRNNITLDNLELISRADNMQMNSVHRYPEEIQETIRTIGVLHRKINRIERDGKSRNSK